MYVHVFKGTFISLFWHFKLSYADGQKKTFFYMLILVSLLCINAFKRRHVGIRAAGQRSYNEHGI
jgi:hypothetical protein